MQATSNYVSHDSYPATVPLSVYRDLAAELQAAQAYIQQLNGQNQHLLQENQLLRQEINNTVQAVMHLQQISQNIPQNIPQNISSNISSNTNGDRVYTTTPGKATGKNPVPKKPIPKQTRSKPVTRVAASRPTPTKRVPKPVTHPETQFYIPQPVPVPADIYSEDIYSEDIYSDDIYIEGQEIGYYSDREPESSAVNSWWILLAIALIIFSAFGAGYLVVRPFINSQSQ